MPLEMRRKLVYWIWWMLKAGVGKVSLFVNKVQPHPFVNIVSEAAFALPR